MTRQGKNKKKKQVLFDVHEDPLINQFQKERNIKTSTMQGYWSSLQLYVPMCGFKNCTEMIQEALLEEKNRVPIKESKINEHLREYKRYLHDVPSIKTSYTIHTYFTKIETFYRHFQVTVPQRPPLKIKKEYHVNYYDLPDKTMIETAIEQSDMIFKAILYFMSSSGTAKAETLNLTVGTFLEGLREYTNTTDPQKMVQELQDRKDLVPVLSMTRQKTNVSYYTCCSSEATYYILRYMSQYKRYEPEKPLFEIKGSRLVKKFQLINDHNEWGFVGPYRRFRTHMLRKFHASNIGCSFEVINTLEGRTNGTIHETYVKQKPDKLKQVYMEHMHNVMIHPELFEGPHCGGTHVVQHVVNENNIEVNSNVSATGMQSNDFMVAKEIGKLELRIEQLEKRLKELEG